MEKHIIMKGSERALEGYEAVFAGINIDNQKKSFEQRYQKTIAQSKAENKAFESQVARKTSKDKI